ncbi:hypothetical protein ACQ4LE_001343 [Meloidogyne hapla]|uniref:CC2D2AN-C2 domain-containing protein n=1 Tax=Meloidogyne hapla TaxID=6305 RepID=A0A1I8BPV5_MELHA
MALFKKQNSSQGWIEPTAPPTEESEDEKAKRLEEITSSDQKIEQSIQIGTKYVNSQLHWEKQFEDGITKAMAKSKDQQNNRRLLVYSPAIPPTQENVDKFKQLIEWRRTEEKESETKFKDDLESGKEDKIPTSAIVGRNMASIIKNNLQNYNKTIWRNPVKDEEWLKLSENRRWATQRPTGLWLDLQDLEFDHHWLFTRAEAAERELVAAYDAWVEVHQQVLNLVKQWLMMNEQMGGGMGEEIKSEEELKTLFDQIVERQTTLERCRAALERAWAGADQTRGRFCMERIKGNLEVFEQDSKDELPQQLGIFFRSPLFVLSEREMKHNSEDKDEEQKGRQQIPEMEKQRRQAVSNCRYQVQIFFNNLLVCSSEEHKLEWPEFSVPFGEIISLRVFEKPEQLCLSLKEKFGIGGNWQLLAEIYIPLPKFWGDEEEEENDEDEDEIVKNKWTAKTGIQFASTLVRGSYKGSLGCAQGGLPFTQGRLFCSLKWQEDKIKNSKNSRISTKKLLKRRKREDLKSSILFQQSILCPEENLKKDARLLKLKKRWENRKNKKENERIPLEIDRKIEKMNLTQVEEEINNKMEDERRKEEEMELERHTRLGKEFVLKLREHLRESGEHQRKSRELAELVREEPVPHFSLGLLASLMDGRKMDLSRRLKPFRGENVVERHFYQDQKALNLARLVLNIQSANAVPQRINGEPMQIYLVCSVKGQTQITSISDGFHSNWQETLIFDILLNEHEKAEEEDEFLTIELFDREIKPFEGDDREKDTRHERVENHWLGFAQISLNPTALNYWKNTKMDGYLSLQTPLFYTGYRLSEDLPTTLRIRLSVDCPSFGRLSASEQLQPLNASYVDVDDNIITECLKFESKYRQHFPKRRIISLVINSSGKRIFLCKYLKQLNPPIQIINLFNNSEIKKAVKLASQIIASVPLINEKFEKKENLFILPIWLTVEEVIRIGYACPDELAILLCCWLMGLKLNSFILLGSTLSNEPNCAFVLTQFSDGEQWIIDPTNGFHFSPTNPNCPLLSIGTVFNAENLFINIQNGEHPSQLNFDFTRKKDWASLFAAEKLNNLASIQSEYLNYEPVKEISSTLLLEMRTRLERELRLAFDETRPFAIPQWNLLASRSLRELLSDCCSFNLSENIQQQLSEDLIKQRLASLLSTFKISLIIFRLPFKNKKQIINQMLSLQIQKNSNNQTQFALAIYLQPLMGNVINCCVAICTLIPIV